MMGPTLVTLMGSSCCGVDEEPSAEDLKVAKALVAMTKLSGADMGLLMGEHPELLGIVPWVAAAARLAKRIGQKGGKLVKRIAQAVKKARKRKLGKKIAAAVKRARGADAAPGAPVPGEEQISPMRRGPGIPKNMLLLGGAGALVALLLFARRR